MFRRILVVLIFCFSVLSIGFAATPISSCTTISSSGEYYLTGNITKTTRCLTISADNVDLDMNGYNVIGGGTTNYEGIYLSAIPFTNLSIHDGGVTNYGYGIAYTFANDVAFNLVLENMNFFGSTRYDLYIADDTVNTNKHLTLKNSSSTMQIRVKQMNTFNVIDTNFGNKFEITGGLLNFTSSTGEIYMNYMVFDGGINVQTNDNLIYIWNLCALDFDTSLVNLDMMHLAMTSDSSDTYNCITFYEGNFDIDMRGHTVTGSGSTSYTGFYLHMEPLEDIIIRNGIINNFGNAFYYANSPAEDFNLTLDNITTVGTTYYDLNIDGYQTGNKYVTIKNSKFIDTMMIEDISGLTMYGNELPPGSVFDVVGTASVNLSPMIGGNYVGNIWSDFAGCSDPSDNYTVSYDGYEYTICNSNDYSNVVSDYAPILSAVYVGTGGGSGSGSGTGSGSGSGSTSSYDFGEGFIGGLFLVFIGLLF